MNSGFTDFKAPSARSLATKLSQRQNRGHDKIHCGVRPSTLQPPAGCSSAIYKKKSMLGRRRTQLFQAPDILTPVRVQPSCNIAKKSPAWAATPGLDHSKFFDRDISQLGPWSVFKKGPPLNGIRTPLYKQRSELKPPLVVIHSPSNNESEDEEIKQLEELEKIPLDKSSARKTLPSYRGKEGKENNKFLPSPINSTLKKSSSLQSSRRVTFSPGTLPKPTQSTKNLRDDDTLDIESMKQDVHKRLRSKMKEYRNHVAIMTAMSSEIIKLQDELEDLTNRLTNKPVSPVVRPYGLKNIVEDEEPKKAQDEEEREEEKQPANYKHLPYTPRSLKKAYTSQFRDIFMEK